MKRPLQRLQDIAWGAFAAVLILRMFDPAAISNLNRDIYVVFAIWLAATLVGFGYDWMLRLRNGVPMNIEKAVKHG